MWHQEGQSSRLHCPEEPGTLLCCKAKASTSTSRGRSSTPAWLTRVLPFKVMLSRMTSRKLSGLPQPFSYPLTF